MKLYLKLGMKLQRIRRVLQFKQCAFAAPYIEQCTRMRAESVGKVRSRCCKNNSNANFGKSIENTRDRKDVYFPKNSAEFEALTAAPNFIDYSCINEKFVQVNLRKPVAEMNKAYAVGLTILDRAKATMYSAFYEVLQPHFHKKGCAITVAASDTDSLIFQTKRTRVQMMNEDLKELSHVFDFSNFEEDHPLYDISKKNCPGHWKLETGCQREIEELVALKSKMYCFRGVKHINSNTVNQPTSHRRPKNCQGYKQSGNKK